ncbi:MAG: hypothetical protein KG003_12145 [Bacteroidetes bacterium]|nr:hypothetical protein [Bacteroidota bacterium]
MKNIPKLLILILIVVFSYESFGNKLDSLKNKMEFNNQLYFGIAKAQYFTSKAESVYGAVQTIVDNTYPTYTIGYDMSTPLSKRIQIGLGLYYQSTNFRITHTNFNAPNIKSGVVSFPVKHDLLSIPLFISLKTPVSNRSYLELLVGVETFKTLKFLQTDRDLISVYKNDGTADNGVTIYNKMKVENVSIFRILRSGLRLHMNEPVGKGLVLGINYYQMTNYFPLEVNSLIYTGNTYYDINKHLYFKGLQFMMGYEW